MNSIFLNALAGKNQHRPPLWLMRQAGRYMPSYQTLRKKYSFLTLCHEPELVIATTHLPIQEFGFDAAIVFSDILLIPQALGMDLSFEENLGPIVGNPLHTKSDLFNLPAIFPIEKLDFLKIAIQELKKSLNVPLIGFAGAPFTLSSYWIEGKTSKDLKKTKVLSYQEPESFIHLIEKMQQAIIASLKMQIDAGCDVVQIFDSLAHVLSERHFVEWCLKPLQQILNSLPKKVPVIYFCKGSSLRADLIAETDVNCISLDWQKPIASIRKQIPDIPLQGNLDPEALFLPIPQLKQEVSSLIASMHNDPGYIFNLGHGILPDTPYHHVQALVEHVRSQPFSPQFQGSLR